MPPATRRRCAEHVTEARTTTKERGRKGRAASGSEFVDCYTTLSAWPGLKHVYGLEHQTRRNGNAIREGQFAITSLSPGHAGAYELHQVWRSHWGTNDRPHRVRDTLRQEDRGPVKKCLGDHNLAAFRNQRPTPCRYPNSTTATLENAWQVDRSFARLGSMEP